MSTDGASGGGFARASAAHWLCAYSVCACSGACLCTQCRAFSTSTTANGSEGAASRSMGGGVGATSLTVGRRVGVASMSVGTGADVTTSSAGRGAGAVSKSASRGSGSTSRNAGSGTGSVPTRVGGGMGAATTHFASHVKSETYPSTSRVSVENTLPAIQNPYGCCSSNCNDQNCPFGCEVPYLKSIGNVVFSKRNLDSVLMNSNGSRRVNCIAGDSDVIVETPPYEDVSGSDGDSDSEFIAVSNNRKRNSARGNKNPKNRSAGPVCDPCSRDANIVIVDIADTDSDDNPDSNKRCKSSGKIAEDRRKELVKANNVSKNCETVVQCTEKVDHVCNKASAAGSKGSKVCNQIQKACNLKLRANNKMTEGSNNKFKESVRHERYASASSSGEPISVIVHQGVTDTSPCMHTGRSINISDTEHQGYNCIATGPVSDCLSERGGHSNSKPGNRYEDTHMVKKRKISTIIDDDDTEDYTDADSTGEDSTGEDSTVED